MKRIGKNKALELVKRGALLVDMRSPVAFRDGHVVGAVNLPLRNFVNRIMPLDKKTKLIIYSDAITDADLRHGTTYATNLGFTDVYVADYKSLIEESRVATYTQKEVQAKDGRKGYQYNPAGSVLLRNRRQHNGKSGRGG